MNWNWIAISAIAALGVTLAMPAQAETRRAGAAKPKLSKSPITPGFWAWPRKKPANAAELTAACREGLAMQLSNGRYLTLRLAAPGAAVTDQGRCTFNPKTQIERCELTVTDTPGETQKGFMNARYSAEANGTLKMTVTGTTTEGPGAPKTSTFDVFPTRCPDDTVYELLTAAFPPK